MQNRSYLLSEFFALFILLPLSFAIEYSSFVKAGLAMAGFIYIIIVLKKVENISFSVKKYIDWKAFWKRTALTFLIIAIITTAFVFYKDPSALFFVPFNKPLLFIIILFVYTFLSVWPQEIIYRTFYFKRYERLFPNKSLLVFINAIIFMLAHIFFRNTLVLILTFTGGLLFSISYLKYRSTTLISIEHALYGNWLFTVGMGQMLAFPGMENV
jgi:membrane protease YdiL (CAAX protease family)